MEEKKSVTSLLLFTILIVLLISKNLLANDHTALVLTNFKSIHFFLFPNLTFITFGSV